MASFITSPASTSIDAAKIDKRIPLISAFRGATDELGGRDPLVLIAAADDEYGTGAALRSNFEAKLRAFSISSASIVAALRSGRGGAGGVDDGGVPEIEIGWEEGSMDKARNKQASRFRVSTRRLYRRTSMGTLAAGIRVCAREGTRAVYKADWLVMEWRITYFSGGVVLL